jgi:excisionase family DNA binding protein
MNAAMKIDAMVEPQSYTVGELMARWKVSRKHLLQEIADGHIRAFRPGRRSYRVTAAEVARIESGARNDEAR